MKTQALAKRAAPEATQIPSRAVDSVLNGEGITTGSRVQRWSKSGEVLRLEGYVEEVRDGQARVAAVGATTVQVWIPIAELEEIEMRASVCLKAAAASRLGKDADQVMELADRFFDWITNKVKAEI